MSLQRFCLKPFIPLCFIPNKRWCQMCMFFIFLRGERGLKERRNNFVYFGIITYPHRRGIRFVLHAVSDRSLSLSLCHFLPSFWNNSATVREGVTKFEMPRQKLLNKCLFLFIAPFDLWPLPWHECANLCCEHDNWRKIAWNHESLQNSHVGFLSLRARTSLKTSLVQLALSRWQPI